MLAEYNTLRELRQSLDTVGENRVNFFLATASGSVVGLALINQLSVQVEILFFLNGAVFVGLFSLGLITFARMVERSVNIILFTRGMNRIRRYFSDRHPAIERYLWLPVYDDKPSLKATLFDFKARRWSLTGLPPMVAIINSIITTVGSVILARIALNIVIEWSLIIGVGAFLLAMTFQYRYYSNRVQAKRQSTLINFPSPQKVK